MSAKAVHAFVTGRVQQVGYRQSCRQTARSLGLVGWVRNTPDGRVEVMACGEERQLKQLQEWLKRGPEMARVLEVKVEEREYQEFEGFSVR